jgi:RNA polymerase sigma factor (sigma-70 family)
MDDIEFAGLIARVKEGDDAAIGRLIERFGPEVRTMVRRRLPSRLRSQFDTVDFTQEVWQSVIADCRERAEPFEDVRHLRGFLAGVVHNKVMQEYRRRTRTQKYDIGREEPLYIRRGDRVVPRELPADDPTPSEAVQAVDRLDQILSGRSPTEVRIVELRREGLTIDEVAARLEIHEKAVRRVIASIRSRLGGAEPWR